MQKFRLDNGLTVLHEYRGTDSIAIQVSVKVGSNFEPQNLLGISHFIEHLVFEGTKNFRDSKQISNKIESLGGELNAYTSNERTCYHIKILKKHFNVALEILSEIIQYPLFRSKDIERERSIILEEVKLAVDEPRFHQWTLFNQALFKDHPRKNPVYGAVETLKKISREDILDYYLKYYVPSNMSISVVGPITNIYPKIKKTFRFRQKPAPSRINLKEPPQTSIQILKEKRKTKNSYAVFGYKTAPRLHKDSYVLDLVRAHLGRGQSGKLFYEIRTRRGLAYEVGVNHDPSSDTGIFAIYFGAHKKNVPKVIRIIQKELKSLCKLTQEELEEAKSYLEGSHKLENENTQENADMLNFWHMIKDASLADSYLVNIKKVRLSDIKHVINKYFTKNYTLAIIEQAS